MKVRNINNLEQTLQSPHGPELKDGVAGKSLLFKRTLSELGTEQQRLYLQNLAQAIDKQGQKLAQKADIKELQKYRELIGEFMNETVSNTYSFDKENSFEARRRHKVFATVNKINAKLEELAKDVLSQQADNLEILNKVDDIRGLILDIIL